MSKLGIRLMFKHKYKKIISIFFMLVRKGVTIKT